METKHTRGPLRYARPIVENEPNPPFVIEPADAMRRRMIGRESVPIVAHVAREDDARLFAAAPGLLEFAAMVSAYPVDGNSEPDAMAAALREIKAAATSICQQARGEA